MNSVLYDQNSSVSIIKMPEILSTRNSNQPLTTSTIIEDIDNITDEKRRSYDPIYHNDDIPSKIDKKQKSLISIYDNNPQQQLQHSLIGIIGRNKRSQAFVKRLFLSGFSNPILCDMNSNDDSNYVSYETFYEYSPTIILITEDLTTNFQDLFPQNRQQLIIDTREIISKNFSLDLPSIPGSYQAFGNLSNWEIENGTQRIGVAIEQSSPLNLIKFIYDLKCFSRGILFLDHISYNNQQIKLFQNCLFPFITTLIIFTICLILSMIEHSLDIFNSVLICRQASSITASTSITLLALVYLIKSLLTLIEFICSIISKKQNKNENILSNIRFIQHWIESRRYLLWYSLSFALLHLIFIIFSKIDLISKLSISAFFFGIFTLIFLFILSYIHFPWITTRLLWNEYHILTSYLGPFCLFLAFIHNYLYWKLELPIYNLKFVSMILPLFVLIIYFILYGIIYPIQWIKNRRLKTNTTLLP